MDQIFFFENFAIIMNMTHDFSFESDAIMMISRAKYNRPTNQSRQITPSLTIDQPTNQAAIIANL